MNPFRPYTLDFRGELRARQTRRESAVVWMCVGAIAAELAMLVAFLFFNR